jgi:hypothetical protein
VELMAFQTGAVELAGVTAMLSTLVRDVLRISAETPTVFAEFFHGFPRSP